jgi:hypothetical protein
MVPSVPFGAPDGARKPLWINDLSASVPNLFWAPISARLPGGAQQTRETPERGTGAHRTGSNHPWARTPTAGLRTKGSRQAVAGPCDAFRWGSSELTNGFDRVPSRPLRAPFGRRPVVVYRECCSAAYLLESFVAHTKGSVSAALRRSSASARELTPRRRRAFLTCVRTVCGDRTRSSAIWFVRSPSL